jgi:voltage-gated potassium channel
MPLPIIPLVFAFARTVWSLLKDRETRGVVYVVIFVLISGMIFYHNVEGWGWLDSLYFSVITLTTVGYGDFSPHTDAGKIFTIVYIIVGLGILAGFLTLMSQKQRERNTAVRERRRRRGASADTSVSEDPIPHDPPESL